MPLRHLVVVVPGIGGSQLESPTGDPLWGQGLGSMARAAFAPAPLAIDEPVHAVGLLPSTRVLPWKTIPGYDKLVTPLKATFGLTDDDVDTAVAGRPPRPGASVVLFPYDFRQPVHVSGEQLAAAMKPRLDLLADGDRRVIVIGHSMGGLVARWWLGPFGGHRHCRALLTVGTPHRGAPKALDWLLNGVHLGKGRRVGDLTGRLLGDAGEALRGWPSTYDLLPRYPAILDAGVARRPSEAAQLPDWFTARAATAFGRHEDLQASWDDLAQRPTGEQPLVIALYGRGHETAARAVVDAAGTVTVERRDAEWLPRAGWLGDGTVPAIAAVPIEQDEDERLAGLLRRFVPEPHLPMAATSAIIQQLQEYEAEPLGAVRGVAGPDRPWLGFDTDDVVVAGEPFDVGVHLRVPDPSNATTGDLAEAAEGTVQGRCVPEVGDDGRRPEGYVATPWQPLQPLPGPHGDLGWRLDAPSLPAGGWRIEIEANLAGVGRLTGNAGVGVLGVEP